MKTLLTKCSGLSDTIWLCKFPSFSGTCWPDQIYKQIRKLDLCLENWSALNCTTRPCRFSILIKPVRCVKCWNISKHRSIHFCDQLIETVLSRPRFCVKAYSWYGPPVFFLWKLILVVALYKGNLLCESLYLLRYKGQHALLVTNGCTSMLNPTSILSTPMGVDLFVKA